jgi:hypothetical protein
MKRIIMLTSVAALALAASSAPVEMTTPSIGANVGGQILSVYDWAGTATALWDTFDIHFHTGTDNMWGTWHRGEDEGGWITGVGEWDPDEPRILGSGTFGGDDSGYWEGIFYPYGSCSGTVWNPDAIGSFTGN